MPRMKRFLSAFAIVCSLAASISLGGGLTAAPPEQNGFSKDRLNRINTVMTEHVQAGRLAGASGMIARNGKIVFRNQWGEMKADSIVRMYSMTKGVTGVAAMMLYEEGKFQLTDPLSKYLPEFANMKVGKTMMEGNRKIGYTVPVEHPITVRDLFRHTSGLDYAGPIDEKGNPAYAKIEMSGGAPLVSFDLAPQYRCDSRR